MSVPFKMKGYSYPGSSPMRGIDPPSSKTDTTSDKSEWVEHTYPAGHQQARGEGWEASSERTVIMSKGTKRLMDAGAPKDIIEKYKANDLANFKKNNPGYKTIE